MRVVTKVFTNDNTGRTFTKKQLCVLNAVYNAVVAEVKHQGETFTDEDSKFLQNSILTEFDLGGIV